MKLKSTFCAMCALTLGIGGQALAGDILVSTLDDWDGSQFIFPFGEANTATYGQTFTAPAEFMTSFTFFLDDLMNPDSVDFEAYIYAWDGSKATGDALYAAGPFTTTNNGGADGFEQFTMDTGNLALTTGNSYVAFFSASNLFDGEIGTANWGYTGSDVYKGGSFVFMNNGDDFDALFTSDWTDFGADLAFEMTFTDIPAPGVAVLLGLAGFVGVRRRRRLA